MKRTIKENRELLDEIRDDIDEFDIYDRNKPPTKPTPGNYPGGRIANIDFNLREVSHTGPFDTFGDQLRAVMLAGLPNQKPDNRLFEVGEARATGMSEGIGSEGGFLVQNDFATSLLIGAFETGLLAKRCMRFDLAAGKNGIELPVFDERSRTAGSRLGGIQGFWKGEGAEKTPSKPKFRLLDLKLKKLIGLCYATDELLQDVGVLEQIIRQGFSDEFGYLTDDAIVYGTGAGQPLGILHGGCLVEVTKETEQSSTEIWIENLVNMFARWMGNVNRGIWLVERSVLPKLYTMGITVGVGGSPIFLPAGGVSGAPYNSILGMPVQICEQCSPLGFKGDIILADFGWYVLIDKPMQSAVSIHVQFIYDESVFRFVYRVDGQPILASAITPASGGLEISPFVTLATR